MKFLVLGGGLQGSACAYDLLRQDDVESVVLADKSPPGKHDFLPDDERLFRQVMDFQDEKAVMSVMQRHEVALSAAPYQFNASLARAAIHSGCDYSDLGGKTEIVFDQLDFDGEARGMGATVIPDVGLAPGLVNVLAAEGVRRLDAARSVRMYVGGLPEEPEPPLNYQVVYSMRGVLDYYTTPSWIVRDGQRRQVEALSEVEEVEFGELGTLEAFHTGGGASTQPWRYEDRVERLEYKTLRYPGHAELMRGVRDLGLLATEPVRLDSARVTPRDVFLACVEPKLRRPDRPDLVALRVVVRGERDGEETTLTWSLLDREDAESGLSAMRRCTGFSLSIAGLMMGRGEVDEPGVFPPDEILPADRYLEELEARGVRVELEESVGETA